MGKRNQRKVLPRMTKLQLFAYRMKLRKEFRQSPKEFLDILIEEVEREKKLRAKGK